MSSPRAAGGETANRRLVLALAGTWAFMTTLDSSIVNISLPAIAHTFGVALTGTIERVIVGCLVVSGACLLTMDRLADMVFADDWGLDWRLAQGSIRGRIRGCVSGRFST
jgi:MFS family permease